jgi:hypothetical protein
MKTGGVSSKKSQWTLCAPLAGGAKAGVWLNALFAVDSFVKMTTPKTMRFYLNLISTTKIGEQNGI